MSKFWTIEDSNYLLRYRDERATWSRKDIAIAEKFFYKKFTIFFYKVLEREYHKFRDLTDKEDLLAEWQIRAFTRVLPQIKSAKSVYSFLYRAIFNSLMDKSKSIEVRKRNMRNYVHQDTDDEEEYITRVPEHSPYFSFENELIDKTIKLLTADKQYQIYNRRQLTTILSKELNIPRIGITNILKNIENEYVNGKR